MKKSAASSSGKAIPENQNSAYLPVEDLEFQDFTTLATGFMICAIALASIYCLARIGFSTALLPIIKTVLLTAYLLFFPILVRSAIRQDRNTGFSWLTSHAALTSVGLVTVVFAGLLATHVPALNLFPVIALLGATSFLWFGGAWLRAEGLSTGSLMAGGAVLLAMWVAGVIWGSGYHSPLFIERLLHFDSIRDTFFHSAISHVFQSYGIPSTGLNGTPYLPYHTGASILFALTAQLLGINPLEFYQLGYPVIFVSFFFYSITLTALEIRNSIIGRETRLRVSHDITFWMLFIAVQIGFLDTSHFQLLSESFLMGLSILMLCLGIGSQMLARWGGHGYRSWLTIVPKLAFVICATIILGFLKVTVMATWIAVVTYIFLRFRLYRQPIFTAGLLLTLAAFVLTLKLVVEIDYLDSSFQRFGLFYYVRHYISFQSQSFYYLYRPILAWLFVLLRLLSEDIHTIGDFWRKVRANQLIDLEILIVIALASMGPTFFMAPEGEYYFTTIQRWVSLVFILACLPLFARLINPLVRSGKPRLVDLRVYHIFVGFVVLSIGISIASSASQPIVDLLNENRRIRSAYSTSDRGYYILDRIGFAISRGRMGEAATIVRSEAWPLISSHQRLLEAEDNYQSLRLLEELSTLPRDERRQSLLYIPRTTESFWGLPMDCGTVPFLAPALSGIAMLDGLPEADCTYDPGYFGYQVYQTPVSGSSLTDSDDITLCLHAQALDFQHIWILDEEIRGQPTLRLLSCQNQ